MNQLMEEAGKLVQEVGTAEQDIRSKQSKNEKKARKAMTRLHLKEVPGECSNSSVLMGGLCLLLFGYCAMSRCVFAITKVWYASVY